MTPFCHSFAFLYLCPIMCASSRSNRSTGLHIGGRPAEGSESRQVGGGSGGLPSEPLGLHWWVTPLCLARVKSGLARSGTPPDRNILRLP